LNYAEKQGKKDINNKDENTYFACEDKKITSKKLIPKIEMPYVILLKSLFHQIIFKKKYTFKSYSLIFYFKKI